MHARIHRHHEPKHREIFTAALDLADKVYEATHDEQAMTLQLRMALMLCPNCMAGNMHGRQIFPVFQLDDYEDRLFFQKNIVTELAALGASKLLWVGCQPFTLRYE